MAAFVGLSGSGFTLPGAFASTAANQVGAGLFYRRQWQRWTLSTIGAVSGGQRTAIGSAAYVNPFLRAAGSVGIVQNRLTGYGAFNWRPRDSFQVSGSHQTFYYLTGRAVTDSFSIAKALGPVQLYSSAFAADNAGHKATGETAGIGTHYGWLAVQCSAFRQKARITEQGMVTETFRHWTVSEQVSAMTRERSYTVGGGYHSNRLSVSVTHGVVWNPWHGTGFEQVTAVTLSFHVRDAMAGVSVLRLPDKSMKWTVTGNDYVTGPLGAVTASPGGYHSSAMFRFVISGEVRNKNGGGVEAAAVRLGKVTVFTDREGRFMLRVKRPTPVSVRVLTDDFVSGRWKVEQAPEVASPATSVLIIVAEF